MSIVANANQFIRGLQNYEKRFQKKFALMVRTLVYEAHKRLTAKTPVHSGQAVRNYIATQGGPYSGPVIEGRDPVEATNRLQLGMESLRPSATRAAAASLRVLKFDDPYQDYWITNKAPQISGLEAGELPEEPYTPRSPLGMFAVTLQELTAILKSGRLR